MTEHVARSEKQLGAILRRLRKQKNFTQAELGEKIHLRQATISKLEHGGPATQLRTIMTTLAALESELIVRPRNKGSKIEIEDIY